MFIALLLEGVLHLIELPLQAPYLFLALINLRGEPSGHALGRNLQVLVPLKLTLEVVDPLLGVDALMVSQVMLRAELLYGLKQVILLLA